VIFHIDWEWWCSNNSDVSGNNFLCSVADNFLYQHINFSTRFRENSNALLLDQIIKMILLTSNTRILSIKVPMLYLCLDTYVSVTEGKLPRFDTSVKGVTYMTHS